MKRALVLDDDRFIAEAICGFLARFGWSGEAWTDPVAALARLQQGEFDVVITDYCMLHLSGIGLLVLLRQSGVTTPAILMSGNASILREAPGFQLNIAAVLEKPFSLEVFGEALTQASSGLREPSAAGGGSA